MATILAVALGGIVGATARVFVPWSGLLDDELSIIDPVPTALVNLIGAALLGLVSGYTAHQPWPEPLLKGVTAGFLCTFTTMSALAVVYSSFIIGQFFTGDQSLGISLSTATAITVVLVVFLWLTTKLTIAMYRLGLRLARSSS